MGIKSEHEVKELASEMVKIRVETRVEIGTSNVMGRDDGGDRYKRGVGSIREVYDMCPL